MKKVSDFIITENISLNKDYFLLVAKSPDTMPEMFPGQFVDVRVENSQTTFLRRPFSINDVDYEKQLIYILIQIVGDGSKKLSVLKEGDKIDMVYPLGNTFTMPSKGDKEVLLIGGGVGLAPMLFLGKEISKQGLKPKFLIGARNENGLLELDEFNKYGDVYMTTEDGSAGEKGYVTQHSILTDSNINFDKIYTCGPEPMMKAVAAHAVKNDTWCEVSLENTMGCGFGVCLCCVTETTAGHKCVCTDGPVFNINDLTW